MDAVSSVRVDDYFSSRKAAVAHRSACDESSGRIYEIARIIEEVFGNDFLYDMFDKVLFDLFVGYFGRVLSGEHNSIRPYGYAVGVFDGHLTFSVRTQVG